jgi:hypothetical protein
VAEYLDNVLPPESVGDFERICLESDMHLAEAAACHHVLTMVLGEPADVDPLTRQRMYTIPAEVDSRKQHRVEPAHVAAPPAAVSANATITAPVPVAAVADASTEGMIPDYLRASAWSSFRAPLLGALAIALLGGTLYLLFGVRGWTGNQLVENDFAADQAEKVPSVAQGDSTVQSPSDIAQASPATPATALPSPPQPLTPNLPSLSAPAISAPAAAELDRYAIAQTDPAAANEADKAVGSAPLESPEGVVAQGPALSEAPSPYDVSQPAEPFASDPTKPLPNLGEATSIAAGSTQPDVAPATESESSVPATSETPTARRGDAVAAIDSTGEAVEVDATALDDSASRSSELGTYLGGKTVLLRHDDQANAWFRVQPRDAVSAGEKLLALPEFRPKITLASGLHLDLSGGTLITLGAGDATPPEGLPAAEADVPAIEVVYGRVVLINTANAERPVRLRLGPDVAEARLERNATLGVEVQRQYVPGRDPRQAPAPVVVNLYAPDGGIVWQDAAGENKIVEPSRWTITDGDASEIVAQGTPPEWIDHEPVGVRSEQLYGAPKLDASLTSDRPIEIQLLELFQGSARKEVKSLSTRSAMHVGLFEPFVDALRDSEQKSNWTTHIETLRSAMALSPESAEKVWQTLLEQRGRADAGDLYEMLCGYNSEQIGMTPEQRKSGAIARLIDWLEEDSLDYRVLAVHDLWEITGMRLMLDPTANATERKRNVRTWRTRLESDRLKRVGEP